MIITNHAKQRLEQRYNESVTDEIHNKMNDIRYYCIMHVQQDGSEIRKISYNNKEVTYTVRDGVVVTVLPEGSYVLPTSLGKIFNRIQKQKINLVPQNKYKDLQDEIGELKKKIKDMNIKHSEQMRHQKQKYRGKIDNIQNSLYGKYFVKSVYYYIKNWIEHHKRRKKQFDNQLIK